MVAYTVYEPRYTADDPIERAEQLVFVKDGFHWWAAIFPALWLMVKGLWLEFAACLVVIGLVTWGIKALGVNDSVGSMLLLIAQVVFGFEAGQESEPPSTPLVEGTASGLRGSMAMAARSARARPL